MKKQIFVNAIFDDNGITTGIVALDHTVNENLGLMYEPLHLRNLKMLLNANVLGGYFFDRFCQFVILVQNHPKLGMSMKVLDFHNNVDLALDHYSELTTNDWNKEDKDKIIQIFQDIENSPNELAEMVIKDKVPFP